MSKCNETYFSLLQYYQNNEQGFQSAEESNNNQRHSGCQTAWLCQKYLSWLLCQISWSWLLITIIYLHFKNTIISLELIHLWTLYSLVIELLYAFISQTRDGFKTDINTQTAHTTVHSTFTTTQRQIIQQSNNIRSIRCIQVQIPGRLFVIWATSTMHIMIYLILLQSCAAFRCLTTPLNSLVYSLVRRALEDCISSSRVLKHDTHINGNSFMRTQG